MFWVPIKVKSGSPEELAQLRNDLNIVYAPTSAAFMASAMHILGEEMGFRASADLDMGRLGDGAPAPLMSYGLIEYLDGLDLSGFDVLEIGGGASTGFWAKRARSVTTLETDPDWAESIRAANPGVTVEAAAPDALTARVAAFPRRFGIIVIDPAANRLGCARAARAKLEPGGFAILDNSDWFPNASRALREAGLIEIDFHDFRPCHHYRATSSIYLTTEFRPAPKRDRLPLTPVGGKHIPDEPWDKD